jgi:hypothetical protein
MRRRRVGMAQWDGAVGMAQWVGAQYEIGSRIVSETLMTLAQVGAANAQALCYFGVWLLLEASVQPQTSDTRITVKPSPSIVLRRPIIRSVRVAAFMAGLILLFSRVSEFLQVLDQVAYAQMYVTGNVAQGYLTQAEGDRLLGQQTADLWPFIFQIMGVLGVTIVLWKLGALIERAIENRPQGS